MERLKTFKIKYKLYVVGTLLVSNLVVWATIIAQEPTDSLKVYFLDVGQGDAILIDSPTHGRVLIDGGRNRKVLSELGAILPFGDRRIDVVIGTHPDADHIGGLSEVISRYQVRAYIHPNVETDKSVEVELERRVSEKKIPSIFAKRGMVLNFNDGVKLVILFPNRDVSKWDTNDASIVAKLVYKEKSFLFTGDSPIRTENILMKLNSQILKSSVLKAGHHGSRTSTSLTYAETVNPEYVVISAGKDNSYGHPHIEVLNNLSKVGASVLSTIDMGTIKFETNGETLKVK
jgi:competence protein ComEC